jgi:PKHD-type hydroxylase
MRLIELLPAPDCRRVLDSVRRLPFDDGSPTALGLSHLVKENTQARFDDPSTMSLVAQLKDILLGCPEFVRTAFPRQFGRVSFSRYEVGNRYGAHVDLPLMGRPGTEVRTDMSFTLYLSGPDDYDGGELLLHTGAGPVSVKAPAGSVALYETCMIHEVLPVTRGTRYVMIGWVESHIGRNDVRSLASAAYDLCSNIGVDGVGYHAADRLAQGLLRLGAQG